MPDYWNALQRLRAGGGPFPAGQNPPPTPTPTPSPGDALMQFLKWVGDQVRGGVNLAGGAQATPNMGPGYEAFARAGALPPVGSRGVGLGDVLSTQMARFQPTATPTPASVRNRQQIANDWLMAERARQLQGLTPAGGSRSPTRDRYKTMTATMTRTRLNDRER